ncbi:type IV secretion system protein VirB9 [Cetobacterium ceti]|uniref:Type IV secretion system protein VirB9 n=1 Tax=Cetobacterium ceti TaxID=180163 RepID=A0A1T4QR09_9FUSO|nr:TrbG/VirB9 family P-type conjugative transfer protein [Cetobacterium ceti]SKA06106.1 type IV secretion system protein VirB9 [Cetobacterium ceti]
MKIKKIATILSFIMATNMYASNTILEQITTSKKPVVISGIREAKNGVQTNFVYNEDAMYTIYCRVNYLTAIMLAPNEQIISVSGGDTARWQKSQSKTGSREGTREVIYIKPFSIGLKTNLIINTNKRMYNINLYSAKEWYNPVIKWLYPDEQMKIQQLKEKTVIKTMGSLENHNYNYTISTKKYDFAPSTIFDDGEKTYFVLKNVQELPVFYIRDKGSKVDQLVNFRIQGNYYIVDRIFEEGVLKLGNKRIVVKNKHYRYRGE